MFQLTKLSEEIAGLTNQLDKVTREKVDVMAELDKAKMQIMQHEVQITKVRQNARNTIVLDENEMGVVQGEKLMYDICSGDNCFSENANIKPNPNPNPNPNITLNQ